MLFATVNAASLFAYGCPRFYVRNRTGLPKDAERYVAGYKYLGGLPLYGA